MLVQEPNQNPYKLGDVDRCDRRFSFTNTIPLPINAVKLASPAIFQSSIVTSFSPNQTSRSDTKKRLLGRCADARIKATRHCPHRQTRVGGATNQAMHPSREVGFIEVVNHSSRRGDRRRSSHEPKCFPRNSIASTGRTVESVCSNKSHRHFRYFGSLCQADCSVLNLRTRLFRRIWPDGGRRWDVCQLND